MRSFPWYNIYIKGKEESMKDYETMENMLGTVVKASNYKATMSWLEDYACANDLHLVLTTEQNDHTVLFVRDMYNPDRVEFDIIYGAAYGYRITMTYEGIKTSIDELEFYSTVAPVDGMMIWNKMMEMYEDVFKTRY